MKILSTKCSEEQQKEDMPELLKLNEKAKETEIMWEFFGGTLTLPNGNKYQVMNQEKNMTIPEITVDTALAVTDKMVSDSPEGAAAWTFGQVQEFMKEQPALFHTITANIAQCYPRDQEIDHELAAGKSLYLVLVTYKLIKSAIEAEELKQLFAEGDADGIQDGTNGSS